MGLVDFTLYDIVRRNSVTYRNKPAWFEVDGGASTTFSRFKTMVDRLTCGLQQRDIKKGDRIGALGKNSLEYFALYGAVSALGAILLPVNWRLSPGEVQFILTDGNPTLLFADHEYHGLIGEIRSGLPSIEAVFNLKGDEGSFAPFGSLMENSGLFEADDVAGDDGFVIIHTAAVAGRPRGALLTHRNLLSSNIHLQCSLQTTSEDVHLSLLPLFHVAGLFMATQSFHAGALNVNMSRFDAERAASLIEEKRVSVMFDFSPVLSAILEQHERNGKNIASLRAVAGIDTPETIAKYQAATGGTFYCLYGQTETSGFATFGRYDDCPGSAGRMLQLAEVRTVDDADRPVAPGDIGEIIVKGPVVFKGYWNLPSDTERTFRGGWHHTGDLGRFDDDGFLWYEGRKAEKELIKPGGENVYPAEVERVILEHPSVDKVVVFGVPDPKWKEGIKAVCRLKEGARLDAQALARFVGERIASYKKPQYVAFVTDFPLLPDGSPDRRKIKETHGGQ